MCNDHALNDANDYEQHRKSRSMSTAMVTTGLTVVESGMLSKSSKMCLDGRLQEWLDGSNRWQLDSKTEKVPSLSPGRGTLTNK